MDKRVNSAVVETRVSRELLAELAVFFYHHGDCPPRSISEMMRMALELLRDVIVGRNMLTPVNDVLEATRALERVGLGKLQKGNRGTKSYYEALLQRDGHTQSDPFAAIKDLAVQIESKTDDKLREGMIRYWEGQGLTREEAEKKIDPFNAQKKMEKAIEPDMQKAAEKARQRDQEVKDALAKGPDESTIIRDEE